MRDKQITNAELLQEVEMLRKRVEELEQAREALLESESKWRSVLKDTPDIVLIVGRDGTIQFINHTVPGISPEEAVGAKVYDYISIEHYGVMEKNLARVFETGQSVSHEIRGVGPHRDLSWYQAHLGPIKQDGRVIAASIITRDITKQKELGENLTQKTEHLGERVKELDCLYKSSSLMEHTERPLVEVLKQLVDIIPSAYKQPDKTCARITVNGCGIQTDNFKETSRKQSVDITVYDKKVGALEVYYLGRESTIPKKTFLKEERELIDALGARIGRFVEHKQAEENLTESEARYRALFQGAAEGIIVADIETMKFKYVNPAICKMLGYAEKELLQLSVSDIHHKENLKYAVSDFNAQARGERVLSPGMPCLRKDGMIIYADIRTTKIMVDRVACNVGFFIDVTERKKAEEKIRQFKEMADRATYGCAMGDLNGKLTYINDRFAEMHGYAADELIGKNLKIFHTDAQLKNIGRINKRLIETGQGIKGEEVWHVHRDGTEFPTLMSNWLLKDSLGNPFLICAVAIDITERKSAEDKLRESEERYRILVENQTDLVVKFDRDGRLLFVSPSYCKTFGKSKDELIGKKFMPFINGRDRKKVSEVLKHVYEPPYTGYVEERVSTKDGWRWQAWLNTAVLNDQKEIESVIAVGRDITEQKLAEEKLQESEEKYRTLVESAGESIIMLDKDGVYLFMNGTAAKRLGGRPEDYVGKTIWDAFPKKMADRQMAIVRKVISTKEVANPILQTELQGQCRWFNATIEPLHDSSGEVTTVMVIARDITEQKNAEEEISLYREKMGHAERLASLGTLSATLAHELNQPLTAIRLSIENSLHDLQEASCCSDTMEDLRDALDSVTSVVSKVDVLRDFARRKSSEEIISEVDLKEVAERIFKLLYKSGQRARIELKLKGMDRLPSIYTNEKDMEQLFFALIENAIQASDGQKNRQLTISGDLKGRNIELRFADTCRGIAPKNLKRIFEPFFTTGSLSVRTGLGLCIVERVVTEAGGKIHVKSKAGKGTTFYITLPVNKSTLTD